LTAKKLDRIFVKQRPRPREPVFVTEIGISQAKRICTSDAGTHDKAILGIRHKAVPCPVEEKMDYEKA
jgi:hypothetical protein